MLKRVVAPAIGDRDRGIERLGLGAYVVLPEDLAGARFERHDEAAAGASLVESGAGDQLLEGAAANDQLAVGQDWRGEEHVHIVGVWELFGACTDSPALFAGGAIERVERAVEIAEVHTIARDKRRAQNTSGLGIEASFGIKTSGDLRCQAAETAIGIAIRPA